MPPTLSVARPQTLDQRLLALDLRALWQATRAAPWSLWFLCLYMMFEYNRLQLIYPALDVIPWGQLTILACLTAAVLEGPSRRKIYGMDVLVGAFFLWVVVSGFLALDPGLAWGGWTIAASWVAMYYLVTRVVVTPRRLLLFWLAFFLVHLKMSQAGTRDFAARGFTFADYGVMGGPGWFSNSGDFSVEMAAVVGMSLCFLLALRGRMPKRRLNILIAVLTGTALITNVASSARGGQLALVVQLALLYVLVAKVRPKHLLIGVATLVIGWTLLPAEQKARFQTMGDDETSQLRLVAWEAAWEATLDNPVTGLGYENWIPYYAGMGGSGHQTHNTVLEASSELGFPGLLLFLAAIGTGFIMNTRTRRRARRRGEWANVYRGMALGLNMALVALFIGSQFYSVLFYPSFWMTFAMTTALAETVRRAELTGAPRRHRIRRPAPRTASPPRHQPVAVHRAATSLSAPPLQRR